MFTMPAAAHGINFLQVGISTIRLRAILAAIFTLGTLTIWTGCSGVSTSASSSGNKTAIPLAIDTNALPSATTGTAYSTSLSASGGQPPYRWNIAHGALPSGVQLSDSTGALSGTRSASGQFPFEIELSGQNGSSVQRDLTLIVTSSTSTPSSSDCDSKPPSAFACGPGDAWRTMAHSDGSIRSRSAADSTNVKIGLKNEEVPKLEPIPI